jgi:autotransporter-associated beta strand protein
VTANAGNFALAANVANPVVLAGGAVSLTGADRTLSGTVSVTANSSVFLNEWFGDTARNLTISGVLSGDSANTLTVGVSRTTAINSSQQLLLSNPANTFAGTLAIQRNLRVNTASATGAAGKTIGTAAVTLAGGQLFLKDNGAGTANQTFAYGNNVTVVAPAGNGPNGGTATIDVNLVSGTAAVNGRFVLGTLSVPNQQLNVTGGNGYSLEFGGLTTLTGASGAAGTFNVTSAPLLLTGGVTGPGGLTKAGAQTMTLGGTTDYAGPTAVNAGGLVVGAGTAPAGGGLVIGGPAGRLTGTAAVALANGLGLTIDNAAGTVADRLNNAAPVSITNGAITLNAETAVAVATDETIGVVTINGANNTITVNRGNAGAVAALTMASLARGTSDAAVRFAGNDLGQPGITSRIIIADQADTNFIGGYATVGTGFAAYSNAVDSGFERGVFATQQATDPGEDQFVSGANVVLTGTTTTTLAGNRAINTLSFANAAGGTRTLDLAGNTLVLEGGGLSANGGGTGRIDNGTPPAAAGGLTAGTTAAATDLFITNDSPLDVFAPVRNNAAGGAVRVIKAGTGVLTLGGPSTFTGDVVVNQGILAVADVADAGQPSHLGAGSGVQLSGQGVATTFRFTGPTDATNRAFNVGAPGATIDVPTAAATLALTGPVTAAGPLTKTGVGTLSLGGTATLAAVSVNGGGLSFGGATTVAGDLNVGTTGTTGNTFTGLAGGTLAVTGGANTSINIGAEVASTLANTAGTANLSALTSFTANVGNIRVGGEGPGANGSGGVNNGSLVLAQSNTITASSAIVVGDSPGNGDNSAGTFRSITFGPGANNVTTPTITVGGRKYDGTATIAAGGTLTLRHPTAGSRVTLNVGENNAGTGTTPTALVDLSAGTADLQLGLTQVGRKLSGPSGNSPGGVNATMIVGGANSVVGIQNTSTTSGSGLIVGQFNPNNPTATVTGATVQGRMSITGGTVSVGNSNASSTIVLGNFAGTIGQNPAPIGTTPTFNTVTGTLEITGGSVTVTPGSGAFAINMGSITASNTTTGNLVLGANNRAVGVLTINGGSLTFAGTGTNGISANGVSTNSTGTTDSTINLQAGLFNVGGRNITRPLAANPLINFNFTGGTLRNLGTLGQGLTQNGPTSVLDVLANNTTISGAYALQSGTASVAATRTLSIAGPLTIGSAGTLGGAGAVTLTGAGNGVANAGTIAPGSSVGTLTVTSPGGVAFAPGGTLLAELDNASADLLAIAPGTAPAGTLDLTAAGDNLVIAALEPVTAQRQYTIATFGGYANGDPATNQFSNLLVATPTGQVPAGTDPAGPNFVSVAYNANSIQVTVNNLSAVPEPASLGLAGLAAVGLLARRRRPAGR